MRTKNSRGDTLRNPRDRSSLLVGHHLGEKIEQTDDTTEFALEAQVGIIRIQFIGQQQQFATGIFRRGHLPDGDLDVSRAIVEFLLVQIVKHIKVLLVLECRIDHSEQPGHHAQYAVALIIRAEGEQGGGTLTPSLKFGEIDATVKQTIKRRLHARLPGLSPLPRITPVKLLGNAAHAGHYLSAIGVNDAINFGLGQIARVETALLLPIRTDACRAGCGQQKHQKKQRNGKAVDHVP